MNEVEKSYTSEIEDALQEMEDYAFHPSLKQTISAQAQVMAIVALREKQQREKGCEYCTDPEPFRDCCFEQEGKGIERKLIQKSENLFDAYVSEREIAFCPHCGRKLVP